MDWDDVRHFLALARTGAVRSAGLSLGVSHSTVARRVEALETRLGVKLFDRHRDGFLLTSAGHAMVARAERVEHEMAALELALAGQDTRLEGQVRVTCPDPWIAKLLLGALAGFCEQHPAIELELDIDEKQLDLSRREADVAVRALAQGAPAQEHLIVRRLAPLTLCSYVATAHASECDPEHGSRRARWLGFNQPSVAEALVASSSYPALPIWGSFESIACMIEAARAGLGIVMLPTYAGDPEQGLQRLSKPDLRHVADFWLVSHRDLRDNVRLRAVREVVTAAIRERAALFRGECAGERLESETQRHKLAPSAHKPSP